ncbi:MAG: type II toxin-antitoxin system VapC family toxin [Nevskia sp.]|nr:type II toxin-antitoxin system VapC family toxin [Nevskia sp.]
MKLLDANVLLYAYNADSPHHEACRDWLEAALNDEETVALPWQTLLAFVRIATNSRAVSKPLTSDAACAIVNQWLGRTNVTTVGYGERFWEIFRQQVGEAKVSGPLVSDAALAALTIEQGATLYSTDRDFRRFPKLKLVDPLQAEKT